MYTCRQETEHESGHQSEKSRVYAYRMDREKGERISVFTLVIDMAFWQTSTQKWLVILAVHLLLLGTTPTHADRILMIGDSWSWPIAPELQIVLRENGHTQMTVDATPFRSTAWDLQSQAGLDDISIWVDERPDATFVQLSTGVNDWEKAGWTAGSWSSEQEDALIDERIIPNVETVVDHILSLRPDIQILWSSYDFPRPLRSGTPTEVNAFLVKMSKRMAQFAATKPGLSFVDINGTLQVAYGFDGVQHSRFDPDFVTPPGDPSLPDPNYPSPFGPFLPDDAWHLVPSGWKALAQAQYDGFYATLLDVPEFQINAGLNDAWYEPATKGQGFFITVFPDLGFLSLAWFIYDTELPPDDATANLGDAGHRWLTGIGRIDGNQVMMDITLTSGGVFDTPTDVQRTDPGGSDGTLILTFDGCNSGTVEYDITPINKRGIVPIQRVATDNITICEALNAD
jgi:hypothetical protein